MGISNMEYFTMICHIANSHGGINRMEYDKSWWIMAILPLGFQGPLTNRWQPPFQGTSQAYHILRSFSRILPIKDRWKVMVMMMMMMVVVVVMMTTIIIISTTIFISIIITATVVVTISINLFLILLVLLF